MTFWAQSGATPALCIAVKLPLQRERDEYLCSWFRELPALARAWRNAVLKAEFDTRAADRCQALPVGVVTVARASGLVAGKLLVMRLDQRERMLVVTCAR